MSTPTNIYLSQQEEKVFGKKSCSSCKFPRSIEGGAWLQTGRNTKRWFCASCFAEREKRLAELRSGQ